jgi:short-subunit dehydrogenase
MRLAGAVALVTGATSGIGAATAAALAAAGASVLLAGRDGARLARIADRTGGVALQADLAAPGGPAALAEAALRASARIDVLVNNAGAGWAGVFTDMPPGEIGELVGVNLAAPMQLTRLILPSMIERRRGHVVFVSSIAGITGVGREAVYAATKAGLTTFAESLAYEARDHGVGISVIVPGVVDTPFFDRRGAPYARRRPLPITPERAARAIVSAVEQDRQLTFVPGWLRLPARLHGVAPATFRALATRFGGNGPARRADRG